MEEEEERRRRRRRGRRKKRRKRRKRKRRSKRRRKKRRKRRKRNHYLECSPHCLFKHPFTYGPFKILSPIVLVVLTLGSSFKMQNSG
jgi:transposase